MSKIEEMSPLQGLPTELAEAVEAIGELGLTNDQVSVFIPSDCVENGLGEELVCIVEGLFSKPERTPEVRKKLAEVVCEVLSSFACKHIPRCRKVEVFVKQFNQDKDGFVSWLR
jgi:hypothetical protein